MLWRRGLAVFDRGVGARAQLIDHPEDLNGLQRNRLSTRSLVSSERPSFPADGACCGVTRGSARFWRLGWVIGSTGDAELPADFLDHFRL